MTFQYIAGFFDGEGCVWTQASVPHRYFANLSQRKRPVLDEIRRFLALHGMKATVGRSFDRRRGLITPQYYLILSDMRSVASFLEHLYPYLIVKRRIAATALRALRKRIAYWKRRDEAYERAVAFYIKGHSLHHCCARFKYCNRNTLHSYLRQRGLMRSGRRRSRGVRRSPPLLHDSVED